MKAKIMYWQETDGKFLGFLNEFQDHWTQGETLEDLREHLRDLHQMFTAETIPGIRRQEEELLAKKIIRDLTAPQ